MSDEHDDAQNDSEGIKSLRKNHEALKKQNDELLSRLSQFEAKERHGSVAEFLKAKGLSADKAVKAAKFYQGDDVSEEKVGEWLKENADVFGVAPAQSQGQGDPNVQGAQRVSAAAFGAADGITNVPQNQQILGNPDEILRAINTLPMEKLQELGYMPKNLQPFSNDW